MSQDINSVLNEVRKSYRLLYNYQKRILDLMSFIGEKYGFTYNGGYPKFSNSAPNKGRGKLDNWAWDWLNFYFYEFNFCEKKIDFDDISFSVFLLSDTGFFDSRDEDNEVKIDKLNTDFFKPTENSETKLIFVVGKNMWVGWGINWDEKEFISIDEGRKDGNNENEFMLFKHYPLESFSNQNKAIECLKNFEKFCFKNRLAFKVKKGL